MNTTGNSSPLAACTVIRVTAPVSSSQRSIGEARVISARKSWIAAPGCAWSNSWAAVINSSRLASRSSPLSCDSAAEVLAVSRAGQELADALLGRAVAQARELVDQPGEFLEAPPALSLSAGNRGGLPRHRQKRNAALARRRDQVFERRLAHTARRNIDDAREGEVVLGIDDQIQIGEDVLDLLPFVERHAADDLIGNLRRAESLLERTRQRGHPAEDGDIGKTVFSLATSPAILAATPSASSVSRG